MTPGRRLLAFAAERQIELPLAILTGILLGDVFQVPIAAKFLRLQYRIPGKNTYGKGLDDAYTVAFWVVMFTFLRAAVMKYVFLPLTTVLKITGSSRRTRFLEQAWQLTYFACSWTLGMYIMYNSAYWFNPRYFWIDYPHVNIPYLTKWYYLVTIGYWLQQFFVLGIEKPRKDHVVMTIHHCITCALLLSSYFTNFTRIGNAVLCMMDFTDIWLSLAKVQRYCGLETAPNVTFGIFVVGWLFSRHYVFAHIVYSIWADPDIYGVIGWNPDKGHYFNRTAQMFFLSLFAALQILMLLWLSSIIRIIMKVLRGSNAEDVRSDSEDDKEE
ncbi:longevity assurance proteins LAG1/LAC1 [Basidiobolus meristosporus CBS 931.73]|uniref:Longevity assurance proteins LAG1/LAC1 n=1 Tax=Basidiobolus meristosporus CBS 931.73 TaxID=1314790 RepID=A0A1Y1Y4R6_9FUNG|nr:longevity assurance proteins LAG1/LAC1 [Basidiobolus meristosporus CBS 931.73]|eukprot:ORX92973.1 longevity assurance proteins LAG1/LAC1 [Basidiobolus meristosporus CBS 931.73]